MLKTYVNIVIFSFIVYVFLLIKIAFSTLLERKVMASIQRRIGPNIVGLNGMGQPLADGIKLLLKETIIPSKSDRFVFIIAPIFTFFISLPGWSVIPITSIGAPCNSDISTVILIMISSLSVYGVILGGWSSNSKYAVMGSIRSIAQMISYEVILGFTTITIFIISGSASLYIVSQIQQYFWNIFSLLPISLLYFIGTLAETNRAPFDLPEAEAELVAGFNVEYSSLIFALFFLGEYANILLMSALYVILFLGGWNFLMLEIFNLIVKLTIVFTLFVWIRATFPRFRFDQLMNLCWIDFLLISFSFLYLLSIYASVLINIIYYNFLLNQIIVFSSTLINF